MTAFTISVYRNGVSLNGSAGLVLRDADEYRRMIVELVKRHDLQPDYRDESIVVYRKAGMSLIGKREVSLEKL